MLRSWRQDREVESVQQFVNARKGILYTELRFQDGNTIATSQRTNPVSFGGSSQHSLLERFVLLGLQASRATGRRLYRHSLQAMIAISVAPALNEAARSIEHLHDSLRLLAGDRKLDRTQSVTLFGVSRLADQLLQ